MIGKVVRGLWAEPRAADPPPRVWRDWVLFAAIIATGILEFSLRGDDLVWPVVGAFEICVLATLMLWRRTHPFAVVAAGFGMVTTVDLISLALDVGVQVSPYTMAYLLLLPYSLLRWASGRGAVLGMAFPLTAASVGFIVEPSPVVDVLVGLVVLSLPAILGAEVRVVTNSRAREIDQVRLRERQELARELHDTVAHHVSAMVVRAQAGRVVGASDPAAALDALRIIETEGSRTLAEMRSMVGALRDLDEVDLIPQNGFADIADLAQNFGMPRVEVTLSGDPDQIGPALGAAAYRIAQESVTNALRHARHASKVSVTADAGADGVHLVIADDGDPVPSGRVGAGYGLVGMTERAALLGGTLEAGPTQDRGWQVSARLPTLGATQ